jgi:hypothetical protein
MEQISQDLKAVRKAIDTADYWTATTCYNLVFGGIKIVEADIGHSKKRRSNQL